MFIDFCIALEQVGRLKPRFRQFILDGCKESQITESGVRGHTVGKHDSWQSARRGQDLEGARKSLAFETDENVLRPPAGAKSVARAEDDALPTRSNRLQEIRRRMGGLGGREPGVEPVVVAAGAVVEASAEHASHMATQGGHHNVDR